MILSDKNILKMILSDKNIKEVLFYERSCRRTQTHELKHSCECLG